MIGMDPRDIEFGGPATYRVLVRGQLSGDWSDRLAGLQVSVSADGQYTTLVGPIRDQAELKGVLDALYGLRLPILEVETVGEKS